MRWTSFRSPPRLSQPIHSPRTFLRHPSTLTSKDQNIATILATDPASGQPLQRTRVVGTVRTIRNQKRRSFVEIGDGSTSHSLQALLEPHQAEGIGTGTSVTLTGIWQRSPPNKEQKNELLVEEVSVIGPTDAERYPLQKKFHSTEYLRTIPHLRLRTPLNALLARLRSECDYCLSSYFRDHGFIRLQPPIITSSDCEGAGEVFTVSSNAVTKDIVQSTQAPSFFFRDPKYLTVSSQLHLEAFINEHPKVWTLSPTFRAERSDTPRHVSEFWMLEAELRTEVLSDLMELVEDMMKKLVTDLHPTTVAKELMALKRRDGIESDEAGQEILNLVRERWAGLTRRPWPRITYSEAMASLKSASEAGTVSFHFKPIWKAGLQLEHERYIASTFGQGSPVFVTDYPQNIKPFYMLPSDIAPSAKPNHRPTVACFDLLLPDGCEVVGGSLREHRLEYLNHSMEKHGLNQTRSEETQGRVAETPSTEDGNLDWYADLRRYGSVPHGGFGLGFDRLLGYLAGIPSIKDVVPWPRYYERCDC